jgi:hypothetical protein
MANDDRERRTPMPRQNRPSRADRKDKLLRLMLADLDDDLFLLAEFEARVHQEPAYFKVIAVMLRALVCTSGGTEGLLWRVVAQPNCPQQLREAADRLRRTVAEDVIMVVRGVEYTRETLIMDVSQQFGLAHESEGVDPQLIRAAQIFVGGHLAHSLLVLGIVAPVLGLGAAVLQQAGVDHGYQTKPRAGQR